MSTADKVRWGVLGTARIATTVGNAIQAASSAALVAIASRSHERAAEWAAEHDAAKAFGGYEALLDSPDIDAVYIPLPPSMHREWTIRAAEHGKHVLCEKPLALSAAEAEEMAAACREHNVQLMDGVMWVHHPRAEEMLRPIHDGTLGDLRRVTSAFSFNREFPPNDLRMQREMGGGALMDLGWYCVRATLWAFGGLPTQVAATGRYVNAVDVNFTATMWFDGQRMASFDCGFDTGMRRWFEVAGTEASLVCDDFTKPWDAAKPRFWLHDTGGKMSEHVSPPPIQEVCMIEDFCRIVQSGQLEDRWPAEAIATQRVVDALDMAARSGRRIELG